MESGEGATAHDMLLRLMMTLMKNASHDGRIISLFSEVLLCSLAVPLSGLTWVT